tara:strand:+ start:126 stop:494 length:369 start_codon:yes stop_codon:yes gene_type:complete
MYAIVVRSEYRSNHIDFINDENDLLQVGYMSHKKNHKIIPHRHKDFERNINGTQEVLLIQEGRLKTNFFDEDNKEICSVILEKGDLILLLGGAHGFDVLEDLSMIEVKNGPYAGNHDKTKFY